MEASGALLNYFQTTKGLYSTKWSHYFSIYERHFGPLKTRASPDRKIRILEIGVYAGGSLEMWMDYFGRDRCEVFGVDINPEIKVATEAALPDVRVFVGDQADEGFLDSLVNELGAESIDIILDDGGHEMKQQILSLEILFPRLLRPGGVYVCEDCHTSYWPQYGGGFRNRGSFMEHSKNKIDEINAFTSGIPTNPTTHYTKWCSGIHFYDSIVAFDKAEKEIEPPKIVRRETPEEKSSSLRRE